MIVFDTRFPRPPGDIGCPQTWSRAGVPARLRVVPGASARRVVQMQDPSLLSPFADAATELAAQGARLITTSCGFLAAWQAELASVVSVPVVTSSLVQCTVLPAPGIVTFDAASLHPVLLRKAGVPEGTPVEGLAPGCELQSRILADDTVLDLDTGTAGCGGCRGTARGEASRGADCVARVHQHAAIQGRGETGDPATGA